MKKIGLVIPYFGKFPSYFQLFLNSCKYNDTIDWILITDIKEKYNYPNNMKIFYMNFEQLQTIIQSKFDFPIVLDKPYKLCDYKPAYGYIFEEYLTAYDFWGYCDVDLLFGDIRKFISDELLSQYDKIGHLGHLSIYRNSSAINKAFMTDTSRYKEVFSTSNICVFDEWDNISINKIFLEQGLRLHIWNDFFDAYPYHDNLHRVIFDIDPSQLYYKKSIDCTASYVTWEMGHIFLWKSQNRKWVKNELAYIHLQKRNMLTKCLFDVEQILCLPDKFVPFESSNIPLQFRIYRIMHQIFDCKRILHIYKSIKYQIAVITSPIRHLFRK